MSNCFPAMLLAAFFFCSTLASAQTNWPSFMASLEPGLSNSTVMAVLPPDAVVHAPESTVSSDKARWSGKWSGWGCQAQLCDVKLVVEKVTDQGASILYSSASLAQGSLSQRFEAKFKANELEGVFSGGTWLNLRMRKSGVIEFLLALPGGRSGAGVLSLHATAYERRAERMPTGFAEGGKPVALEVVIFKPPGPGPFPTVMFNHGSTGMGDKPASFTNTWTSPGIARFFVDRGWLVAFPQRRGRGKSDGLYDEGFEQDRSRYSCNPEMSLPGVDHALADMEAAAAYLLARPEVDGKRMLIGGVSRGGILSVAYAGTRPSQFIGVINFVGGWMSDGCRAADAINPVTFKRGAAYPAYTLWLYGENDSFYKMEHSKKNFDAFVAAGGKGTFMQFPTPPGQNGHSLPASKELWQEAVEGYVQQLERK